MARDYGRLRTSFWDNPEIKACAPITKLVAAYLVTSNHANTIGCFRLPIAYISDDTGLDVPSLEAAFVELRSINFMQCCERLPWIWIPNYLKHNPLENPNVWRKAVKELASLPGVEAQSIIAAQLQEIAREPRMSNEKSKTRVSEEEITVLERYRSSIDTLPQALRPIPIPSPIPKPDPKPSSLRSEDAPQADAPKASKPILPDWLPKEAWKAFQEMRRAIRAPLTGEAMRLAISDLEKLRASGQDPGAVLEQSVMRSWRGLFPIEAKKNGSGRAEGSHEQTERIARELLAEARASNASPDHGPDYGLGVSLPRVLTDERCGSQGLDDDPV